MKAIHQLVPSLSYGDAISNHAVAIQQVLTDAGYESAIYTGSSDEKMQPLCRALSEHRKASSRQNGIILHHAVGSRVSDYATSARGKKLLFYHNITPPHFFLRYNDSIYKRLELGRSQLKKMRKAFGVSVADSEYNARELRSFGYKDVRVLPIMLDFSIYERASLAHEQTMAGVSADGLTTLLFVGRIAPNKKVEDVLRVFAAYQKRINPCSRLLLVGKVNRYSTYHTYLLNIAAELNVKNYFFLGTVAVEALVSFYRMADIFLLMSEHEGFGVPLVEAMFFGAPVLAYKSTAVPETLGNAGVLINEKNYDEIAELIHLIVTDESLRNRIISTQGERLRYFDKENTKQGLLNIISDLQSSSG